MVDTPESVLELNGSIKGLGEVTVASLIAELQELRKMNRRKINALNGVASRKETQEKCGVDEPYLVAGPVYARLYMVALAAMQFIPADKEFY